MAGFETIGFIGLGVMGEPICRNLIKKSGRPIVAFDLAREPLQRIRADGATIATTVARVVEQADLVFFCLPSGKHVQALFGDSGGILETARAGQIFVDLGTSPVKLTRELADKVRKTGADYADAPIARTREAAIAGTLSVMVGATPNLFAMVEPVIRCFASEVTNCGSTGAGQVTKILNNMVLFQSINALSEAYVIAKRSGVDPKLLFETLAKGSADIIRAAQPWPEGDHPRRVSGARVFDRVCAQGFELCARARRRRWTRYARRKTCGANSARSDRRRPRQGILAGDFTGYRSRQIAVDFQPLKLPEFARRCASQRRVQTCCHILARSALSFASLSWCRCRSVVVHAPGKRVSRARWLVQSHPFMTGDCHDHFRRPLEH